MRLMQVLVVWMLLGCCWVWGVGSESQVAKRAMVVSQERRASVVGMEVMREGGNAVDAAVATALALAVVHPPAGNVGGGGFLVYRSGEGEVVAYDFREVAPLGLETEPWLVEGEYDEDRHHEGHGAVGVPGSVAGLYLAWQERGRLPWRRLVEPAVRLAGEGFEVTAGLADSLEWGLGRMRPYAASVAQFTMAGELYVAGDVLRQPDLARTLQRIAEEGARGFYEGETARLLLAEMERGGGFVREEDLRAYRAKRRQPVVGSYRGHEVISMSPPSSGGVVLVEMLNILEGVELGRGTYGSARDLHWMVEAMRRGFGDRAQFLGDPDFNPDMPLERLMSKAYADELRSTIDPERASVSVVEGFGWEGWGHESEETTHLSVVDAEGGAVSLTTTLEYSYGSGIVVAGGGFLLNNEMGDFNAGAGLTHTNGLIGSGPNLLRPGKRMLSSMTPTIVAGDEGVLMVTGSPGGRSIINTVLQTIVNVVDYGMGAQEAVDAGRIHHAWFPDAVYYERFGVGADTLERLRGMGYRMVEQGQQGAAQVIVARGGLLEAGVDRRDADSGAAGW